jgi:hypothetical protein
VASNYLEAGCVAVPSGKKDMGAVVTVSVKRGLKRAALSRDAIAAELFTLRLFLRQVHASVANFCWRSACPSTGTSVTEILS